MSYDERLRDLGRKAELQKEIQSLATRIKGALELIRLKADLFAHLGELDGQTLAEKGVEVEVLRGEWQEKTDQLKAINKALGVRE